MGGNMWDIKRYTFEYIQTKSVILMATSTEDVREFIKIPFGGTEFRYCFADNTKQTQKSRKTAGSLFSCKPHQKESHICVLDLS